MAARRQLEKKLRAHIFNYNCEAERNAENGMILLKPQSCLPVTQLLKRDIPHPSQKVPSTRNQPMVAVLIPYYHNVII